VCRISFQKKKKGQAAVELLTMYGWAVVALVILIGALFYFDVFNAKRFKSEKCESGSQIECMGAYTNDQGNVYVALKSNYEVGVVIVEMKVNAINLGIWNETTGFFDPLPALILPGKTYNFGKTNTLGALTKGSKYEADIVFTFKRNSSDVSLYSDCVNERCYNISGNFVSKVQDYQLVNPLITH
jgi:hypothetical protein